MPLETVTVPEQFEPIFADAEVAVREYFDSMQRDPTQGIITVGGERYVLMRAESMSLRFIEHMMTIMGREQSMNFLYAFAKVIGQSDAKSFHKKMKLDDPIKKLSAGPIHFSFTGWALVDIFAESNPSPDENYYLIYDHPNTFESETYMENSIESDIPVCIFSAGYSAGWCMESFGITLDAKEIRCKAKGDDHCRFIMAPPLKLDGYVAKYNKEN